MIWIGMLSGIVAMLIFALLVMAINSGRDKSHREYESRIMDVMLEGNTLRECRNEILDRIADNMGVK